MDVVSALGLLLTWTKRVKVPLIEDRGIKRKGVYFTHLCRKHCFLEVFLTTFLSFVSLNRTIDTKEV